MNENIIFDASVRIIEVEQKWMWRDAFESIHTIVILTPNIGYAMILDTLDPISIPLQTLIARNILRERVYNSEHLYCFSPKLYPKTSVLDGKSTKNYPEMMF